MNEKSNLMTFDLNINLKEFELKSGIIDIKEYLNLNEHISKSIINLCSFSHYVNFAETIVDGFQINGKLDIVFNHKRFIQSLKYLQEKNKSKWSGYFTYEDRVDSFIFYAPDFQLEENNQ